MIQAIVFDMDGVLFDTERLYNIAWRDAAEEFPLNTDFDGLITRCIGLNHADTRVLFDELLGTDFPFDDYFASVNRHFKQLIDKDLPIKDGVYEILNWLKEKGVPTALATSTSRKSALSHLERTRLLSYFDAVITGDMVEHSKPAPDIYLLAYEALHQNSTDCIAVEDSPNGIRSAYAAKMMPVMVPDQLPANEELRAMLFLECASLCELLAYLKEAI